MKTLKPYGVDNGDTVCMERPAPPLSDARVEAAANEEIRKRIDEYTGERFVELLVENRELKYRLEQIVSYCQAIIDGRACEIGLARAIVDGYGTPEFATAADAPTTNPAPVSSPLVVRDFPDGLVRESVAWFAEQMERKLRLHDDRPGWMGNLPNALLDRVREEVAELDNAIDYGARAEDQSHPRNIIDECADVANMAMMIADNMRECLPPLPAPISEPPTKEGR